MHDKGVGGREPGFPQGPRGGDTALREPVPGGRESSERARRERGPVQASPRRASRAPGPRPVRPRGAVSAGRPAVPTCTAVRAAVVRSGAGGRARGGEPLLRDPFLRGGSFRGRSVRGGSAARALRPVPVLPAHILRRRQVAATIGMALLAAVTVVLLGLLADVAAAARAPGASGAVTGSSLTAVPVPSGQVAGVGSR